MKLMIASDIHGSAYWCKKMLEAFEQNGAEKLILLGDILYHGPRNDLPEEYAPKQVIAMLNPLKDKLLCVRGNCDTEVDQMVLDFPVMAEYAYICCDGLRIFATHGHKFNCDNMPPLSKGDILLHGQELPLGLSMALAQVPAAYAYFAKLDPLQRQQIIDSAHCIRSKEEMRDLVNSLSNGQITDTSIF